MSSQPSLLENAQFRPKDVLASKLTSASEHCATLASRGFCEGFFAEDMRRFCRGSCDGATAGADVLLKHHRDWAKLSLYDYRHLDPSLCDAASERRATLRGERCSDPEDMSRIVDRGWAIRRGMVDGPELEAMAAHVGAISQPARSMCGAGGFQPRECFLAPGWEANWPRFHRSLKEMLEGWLSVCA